MSRTIRRCTLALVAGAAVLSFAACGTEQEAGSSGPTDTSSASIVSGPSGSAPVVGGPRPGSATTSVPDSASAHGRVCGKVAGPDGALRVIIIDGDISCGGAQELAEAYGPKIATGQPHTVNGWQCGPSQDAGMLATCAKGDVTVGFTP